MRIFGMAIAGIAISATAPASAQSVFDNWLTEDRRAVVTIERCGSSVCGRISRVLVAMESGQRDINNPSPRLRNRTIEGLRVLSGFSRDGNRYRGGEIYDPEDGRNYNARFRLINANTLRVTGCVLGGIVCQSQDWRRR
ncbi:MAG: DUF2147 domain-containing protein [Sphingomonadaceae bacterium]|nr:DUF2147 domain-containing protein [Sphingomonadaceae bacterium]